MIPDWRKRAACLEADPELFFVEVRSDTPAGRMQTAEAKAWCARCPVQDECLDWGLEIGAQDGVFGGLDEDEREPLLKERRQDHRDSLEPETAQWGEVKACWACGQQRPVAEFHRDRSRPDGRQSECRPCRSARDKQRVIDARRAAEEAQEQTRADRIRHERLRVVRDERFPPQALAEEARLVDLTTPKRRRRRARAS